MKTTAAEIVDKYREMFNINNSMDVTKNILEKCTNAEGKHVDFDVLMESSKNTVKGYSYDFAKTIWDIFANTDKTTFKIADGFVPACGFER